jgi:hypothetical protein
VTVLCGAAHTYQEVLVLRKKVGGRQAYRDESGDPRGDSSDGEITETECSQPMSVDQLFHDTAGWKVRNVALGPGNGLFLPLPGSRPRGDVGPCHDPLCSRSRQTTCACTA